jgi:hypothetical protein
MNPRTTRRDLEQTLLELSDTARRVISEGDQQYGSRLKA